jgi:hypothetical protein
MASASLIVSLACFGVLLAPGPAANADPQQAASAESAAEIGARLSLVKSQAQDDASVRGPAEQAALALARAQDAKHDADGRARSLDIARAALALAEARLVLRAERNLMQRAEARQKSAAKRAASAQLRNPAQ